MAIQQQEAGLREKVKFKTSDPQCRVPSPFREWRDPLCPFPFKSSFSIVSPMMSTSVHRSAAVKPKRRHRQPAGCGSGRSEKGRACLWHGGLMSALAVTLFDPVPCSSFIHPIFMECLLQSNGFHSHFLFCSCFVLLPLHSL